MRPIFSTAFAGQVLLAGCVPLEGLTVPVGLKYTCLPVLQFLKAADGNCFRVRRPRGQEKGVVVKTYVCGGGVIIATDLGDDTTCFVVREIPGSKPPVFRDVWPERGDEA